MHPDKQVSSFLPHCRPWAHNQSSIWLMSTLALQRNLEKFKFPAHLNAGERLQIVSLLRAEFAHIPLLESAVFLRAEEIPVLDKELLFEYFMPAQSFVGTHTGESFIVDRKGRFLATINVGNHLELTVLEPKEELEQTLQEMVGIESSLGRSLQYAYSAYFGFLTSDPTRCGTAFMLRAFLQLPALIYLKKLEAVLSHLKQENLTITGLNGTSRDFAGDMVIVSNHFTLGVTEEMSLSFVRHATMRLIAEEKALRSRAKAEGSPELMDRVSRAYGVIMHSYKIEAAEAMGVISLLKLAVDLEWLTGVEISKLNELFFHCRRGHFTAQMEKGIPSEQLPHHRSLFLHQALAKAVLKI